LSGAGKGKEGGKKKKKKRKTARRDGYLPRAGKKGRSGESFSLPLSMTTSREGEKKKKRAKDPRSRTRGQKRDADPVVEEVFKIPRGGRKKKKKKRGKVPEKPFPSPSSVPC